MLRTKDILDESDSRVRASNTDVTFPLNDTNKNIIPEMLKHLRYSQIEKYSKKYDLRPGMGLAAPQLGINERFFVVCYERDKGKFEDYVLINPKVISYSEEMIYAGALHLYLRPVSANSLSTVSPESGMYCPGFRS